MEDLCLIIKAPSSKHDDFKIDCQLSWTILDLKIHLCKEYPSKPNISDQRLIYSGHLLKDEQSLRDIIQTSDTNNIYTFHLVCSQRSTTASTPSASSTSSDSRNNSSQANGNASASPLTAESTSGLANDSPAPSTSEADTPTLNPFGSPSNMPDMRESYNAMMHHYYQYMSYYYQSAPLQATMPDYASYYAFTDAYLRGMNGNIPGAPNVNPANNGGNNGAVNGANPAANVAAAAVGNGIANANNNRNGINNNQDDNDEPNRDWTDMLYSFSKAMVMFSIIYFYSSFSRMLLLFTISLVLYLYRNARVTGGVQNALNNNNNVPDNDAARARVDGPANNNNNDNDEANRETEAHASPDEVDNNNDQNGAIIPENSQYSGLRLVWVIVSSLFTSLIPDPVPIN